MARKIDIIPDAQYDPTFQPTITSRTRLAHNITLSKFLGSYNDPVTAVLFSTTTVVLSFNSEDLGCQATKYLPG